MIKRTVTLMIVCILAVMLAPLALAADMAEFTLSKQKTYLGDEITVTLTFSSDKNNIADIQGNISFNDKVLEFIESDDVTYAGGGNLSVHAFTDTGSENSYTMSFKFKTIGEGDGFIRLINCQITDSGQNGVRSPTAQTSISVAGSAPAETKQTTDEPEKTTAEQTTTRSQTTTTAEKDEPEETTATQATTQSSANGEIPEGKLKELKISTGYISPAFSYDVLEYEIHVPHDCTWLDIEGVPSLEGGYIWYTGDENVYDGVITRTIAVRDSQDVETVYTFNISRMTEDEEEKFDDGQGAVTAVPEDSANSKVTTTTRALSLDKKSSSFKKMIAAAGIVIVVILVVIVAILSSKNANKNRKKIKHTKRK